MLLETEWFAVTPRRCASDSYPVLRETVVHRLLSHGHTYGHTYSQSKGSVESAASVVKPRDAHLDSWRSKCTSMCQPPQPRA